jgi:hypothetical protein
MILFFFQKDDIDESEKFLVSLVSSTVTGAPSIMSLQVAPMGATYGGYLKSSLIVVNLPF